jgi:pimeloyl-ACP methyl ester carboxylesterase
MNVRMIFPQESARRERAIALHCSGAGAGEWRCLVDALGHGYEVLTPEHYGCESRGPWTGEHAFTLADEAAESIALIDESEEKVHLVGHSYGGGVALYIALSRPNKIATMTLYEPSAFHLLRQMGEAGGKAFAEISGVARRFSQCIVSGDYRAGVADFIDYWGNPGTWKAMRPAVQNALIRWSPKGPLDFHALIEDPTPAKAYRLLNFPVLILRGEHAPLPTRVISERLLELLPRSRLKIIAAAGHMGPLTHASEVSQVIVAHIATAGLESGEGSHSIRSLTSRVSRRPMSAIGT